MKRFWRHLSVIWLAGCASVPPRTYPAPEPALISASFDRTWGAVIDHFAETAVPIRTIEKASGFIATEPLAVPEQLGRSIADCGVTFTGIPWDVSRASYNVRVVGDSATSTVRVTAIFVAETGSDGCNSRGVYERDLLRFIKERAEKR